MAYVLWRVFMKKYSKVRLGIHRNALPPINSVTPTGRHVRSFDESSWKITDEHAYMSTVAATQCVKSNPSTTGGSTTKEEIIKDEKSGDELSRNEVRKSKTKRVKNYLKKCKDVALGTTSKSSSINDETTKNNPSNTSWYVPNDETGIKDEPKDTNAFITVVTISDDIWETVDDLKPAVDTNLFEQYNNSENLSIEKPNELVENVREEQDTDVNLDVTVPPCADIASTCVQTELNDSNHLCDLKHSSVFDSSSDVSSEHTLVGDESADDKLHVQLDTKECEVKCDVASLVDRLLGPLYPNFKNTRSVLVRQARDILVCEYMGNISKFETEFCIPAATLLRHVKNKVEFKQKKSLDPNSR
ncbi:uncharacterized protein LOC123296194 [Chrysoperla carnea]|uniref:uncharacterized protein LOC123296194 n=1 Tax=Chrysoperla carnea TaxID=189513 RepID=UPI001D082CDB|nr:uncharacterized protein LOC123296194 [Chrysoperla carnea]